jgi:hypothetical protein
LPKPDYCRGVGEGLVRRVGDIVGLLPGDIVGLPVGDIIGELVGDGDIIVLGDPVVDSEPVPEPLVAAGEGEPETPVPLPRPVSSVQAPISIARLISPAATTYDLFIIYSLSCLILSLSNARTGVPVIIG